MMSRFIQLLLITISANSFIKCTVMGDIKKFESKLAAAAAAQPKICANDDCKKIANEMLEKMNRNANPCDDFNEFVCGNYLKNAIIPDEESSLSMFSTLRKKVKEELRENIKNGISDKDPKSFKTLQSYYNVCMNEEQIKRDSEKEFLSLLKKLGGWPVLDGESWKESSFDWKKVIHKYRDVGYSYNIFVGFKIDGDLKNNTQRMIYLDQAALGISQEYLLQGSNQKIVKAYFKYMVDLAEIFGANRDRATKELKESLDFEIELAKISLSTSQRRNSSALYNPMTLEELQSKYSFIPWREYINRLMSPYARLKPNEIISVAVPSYFEKFQSLIEKTPKRVLANYAYWRVVKQSAGSLSERVKKAQKEYSAVFSGISSEKPRWMLCTDSAKDSLHLAASSLYIRRNFDKKSKDDASEILYELKNTFRRMLQEVDWMKNDTKKRALDKLDNMLPIIGYPDELLDDKKLDDYYRDLKIHSDSLLKTMLSLNVFSIKKYMESFRKPILRNDWTGYQGDSATVNAFFESGKNLMMFPAAILQGAFFDYDHPKYMNYAAIGSIAGHEMTHGFDDIGRKFDKDGNLIDWWDSETEKEYLKKAECIVKQYSNYKVKEVNLNVDGSLTQGENIADNGGIRQAYYAYDSWQKANGEEPRLPGFEMYSTKQMFWISYAHSWCGKYRPEYLSNLLITDPHTPNQYRVIGTASNMQEFAADFNCPVGSYMNPEKKCSVW